MPVSIHNLTPHVVTIIRDVRSEYPACAPSELPRAIEAAVDGDMRLTDARSDGQGGYENHWSMVNMGTVDFVGYVGVENLPPISVSDRMFGVENFYIVSVVTALGALAAGRGVEDLLVPMGQVRDGTGRIIGATGLAPATHLLTPIAKYFLDRPQPSWQPALELTGGAGAHQS